MSYEQRIEQIAKEEEQAYKQIIKEGDDFFNTKSYDKARASYELAKSKRPNDTYPASKLAEIDAILNPVIVEISI